MDEQEAKTYSDHIMRTSDEMIHHQIATMTSKRAISIIKEAHDLIQTAPDPEGANLGIEIRLAFAAQWLAGMGAQ